MGNKVRNENFVNIMGWMVNDLGLKGNELIIYAIIYGFSQTENQTYNGNLQYLADWTNSTKQGVIKSLKSLIEKNLIEKTEKNINGIKVCEYHVTKFNGIKQSLMGIKQSLMGGIKQSLTNNIYIDNISNNIIKNYNKKEIENDDLEDKFNKFWKEYPKKVSKETARKWFIKNKPNDELFNKMIKSLERFKELDDWKKQNGKYIPYPSTWLNQKRWEDEFETDEEKINRIFDELEE